MMFNRTSNMKRLGALALLVALLTMTGSSLFIATAGAHAGDQSYLYIDITSKTSVRMEMPFSDVQEHLGLNLEGSSAEIASEIEGNSDLLREYARAHFDLGDGATTWDTQFTSVSRVLDISYLQVDFDLAVEPEDFPQQFVATLDPFFDEDPDRDALLLIGNDWGRGYVENEADSLLRFTPDSRTQNVDLGDASQWKNFKSSISLGLDHIKTGPDHILFVAVLLLPSVLVFFGNWSPGDGFARSLWRVLKIVSMFTLAHSITFTLAGLGIIPLPSSRIVESIIALSIAAAALHNLRPIIPEKEWLIAFAFGLFHGLGFASLVAELDISKGTQLVSLLGRNVGIEIGQALVVLLSFPALFLLRRTRAYMPFFKITSVVLIIVSIGWLAERLFDANDITSRIINRLLRFPDILVPLAIGTIVAGGLYLFERRNDQLLDVTTSR